MKDAETKMKFVEARAAGKSYATIHRELGISKSTCSEWDKAFKEEVTNMRRAEWDAIYEAHGMTRRARIEGIAAQRDRIAEAISQKSLEELPADKLLELYLKYQRELKAEFVEASEPTDNTLDGMAEAYEAIIQGAKEGIYGPNEVKALISALDAKKDTLIQASMERRREKEGDLGSLLDDYISDLIRKPDAGDGVYYINAEEGGS